MRHLRLKGPSGPDVHLFNCSGSGSTISVTLLLNSPSRVLFLLLLLGGPRTPMPSPPSIVRTCACKYMRIQVTIVELKMMVRKIKELYYQQRQCTRFDSAQLSFSQYMRSTCMYSTCAHTAPHQLAGNLI